VRAAEDGDQRRLRATLLTDFLAVRLADLPRAAAFFAPAFAPREGAFRPAVLAALLTAFFAVFVALLAFFTTRLAVARTAVPPDFAFSTTVVATDVAADAALPAVSLTVLTAVPNALPTTSAVLVSAPSSPPELSIRSSDIGAPFGPTSSRLRARLV
jgi:hypothetical protein